MEFDVAAPAIATTANGTAAPPETVIHEIVLVRSNSTGRPSEHYLDSGKDPYNDVCMRTTINIRDDLMRILKQEADARGKSLTALVNNLLRQELMSSRSEAKPLRQRTANLGKPSGINLDKALLLASELESEYTLAKMELRK